MQKAILPFCFRPSQFQNILKLKTFSIHHSAKKKFPQTVIFNDLKQRSGCKDKRHIILFITNISAEPASHTAFASVMSFQTVGILTSHSWP